VNHKLFVQYQNLSHQQAYLFDANHLDIDDLIQEANIALWQAIDTYDTTKSMFSTYATRCIKNRLINYVNKTPPLISLPADIPYTTSNIDDLIPSLSTISYNILQLRLSGYTYKDIAKIYNVSISYVYRNMQHTIQQIKKHNV
jgi:DNA-directed RNA polymerase specialized sigma subunit